MSRPLVQIDDVVREMNDIEYAEWQAQQGERDRIMADNVRDERNKRLAECDWTQLADAPVDDATWAVYRQALRDIPTQAGFPWNITWPAKP